MMKKTLATCVLMSMVAATMGAQDLDFVIDPAKTWTDGAVRIQVYSQGTFQGAYDPFGRPFLTQTKVGTGGWARGENDPVDASPYLELGRAALVRTSGTFRLSVDTTRSTATLTGYRADRVPERPMTLNATVALNNAAFRTLKPTWSFSDHLRPFSFGFVTIDKLTVRQLAGSRTATIVPLGRNEYLVVVTFMAEIQFDVKEFGQAVPITFDAPYSLAGVLKINGTGATFGYPRGQGGDNLSRQVDIPLRPFPFLVPTDGLPASLIMSTSVKRLALKINGVRQFHAVAR